MFEIVSSFEDGAVSLLHRRGELASEANEDVSLPGVVLGVDLALHLFVIDDGDSERARRFRVVERRSSLSNLEEKLLPRREGVTKSIVDVIGFEIPEGLELKPFVDVGVDLSKFALDQSQRSFQRTVSEFLQLHIGQLVTYRMGGEAAYESDVVEILSCRVSNLERDLVGRTLDSSETADDGELGVKLSVPRCSSSFDWRVEVNDLILHSNFVYQRLECERGVLQVDASVPLQDEETAVSPSILIHPSCDWIHFERLLHPWRTRYTRDPVHSSNGRGRPLRSSRRSEQPKRRDWRTPRD